MKLLNLHTNKPWPTKRPSHSPCKSPILFLTLLFSLLFFLSYYYLSPTSLLSSIPSSSSSLRCPIAAREKFLYYAPHSGFSNQLSEFRNAVLIAGILNRTVVVPPILDHHAVALGSCPKFRVMDPGEIRVSVWNHAVELVRSGRYVSIADIIDISSLASSSTIKFIDFRVFASQLCNLDLDNICSIDLDPQSKSVNSLKQCGSRLSSFDSSVRDCVYAVDHDCRTTVWTYRDGNKDGLLDSFQPDEELKRKKKIPYVRRRRDIYESLGPGSEPGSSAVLAFGSLFSGPYKGSESHVDIHESSRDERIQNLIEKIEYLPFVPEITGAGKKFVRETIRAPFLCAQLRLLDGQFKNHWKTTFLGLKQKIESLGESAYPIHVFVMTDLPEANWNGNYLGDLAGDSRRFKLFYLKERDELVIHTATRIVNANRGLSFGYLPKSIDGNSKIRDHCRPSTFRDVLLYLEETVCSCASLGFVGTSGSTIAESIELMRKFGVCSSPGTGL